MPGWLDRLRGDTSDHVVHVHYVDPPDKSFEPYYTAICDTCSEASVNLVRSKMHVPEARASAAEAFEDARRHSRNVRPDVLRPLDAELPPPE